ncbi:helix-turn-helix domain-containing protein [Rhizobium leguminosarum]|uniref:helix-turn-helix domain-containing protein n=1 Tax=Rhizobium ruizarguesonis TaxID=2081791 RepID=UPI0013DFD4B6|nr:helix-turn-helix domain-containing protein [Rhizobium ruizarguesonis]NEJ90008.1 helix-turn-helix domain-containing protein [Rhizobium ruizarguesonis]
MESDQQYAQRLVRQFKTDSLSQIVASGLGGSKLLVSRVRRDTPGHGLATPTRPDSVFSILVQLRKQERRELYLNDRLVHAGSFLERTVSVVNHWESPKANLLSAFDTIIFTVPQTALDEVAYEKGVRPVPTLTCENEGRLDQTIWSLAQSLLPALDRPDEVGSMYAERVLLASTTYFAQAFGGLRQAAASRHRLSRGQVNRVFDLMHDQLDVDLSLSALASEMDLTPRQFVQAFRRTTGTPPDRWLRHQRVEHAKTMLRTTSLPIWQIARACGFVSTDHFARVFMSIVGIGPADWRRQVLN